MTMLPDIITNTINSLNQKYDLDITIDTVDDSKLLPTVNKRMMRIRYNIHLAPLFMLYRIGNANLIIKYFLTHKYLSYNMYSEADYWLEKTKVKVQREISKSKDGHFLEFKGCDAQENELLSYQQLFVFLHEYSHCLFHKKEECKRDCFFKVQETLKEFEGRRENPNSVLVKISKNIHWFSRSFLLGQIGYGFVNRNLDLIKEISSDEKKIEEFACDFHALQVLISFLECGKHPIEIQEFFVSYAIQSLYYLENYKVLDDCLAYKVDINKAEHIALFDSLRYSILIHTFVSYLEGKEEGRGITFDRFFDVYRWDARKEFLSQINRFVPLTKDLEEGCLIPKPGVLDSVNNRIKTIDNLIETLYACRELS